MRFDTIREAAEAWVQSFNAIPQAVIKKLMQLDWNDVIEITPPSVGDRVYIFSVDHDSKYGEIIKRSITDSEVYLVEMEGCDEKVWLNKDSFCVERDGALPMWMWSFSESIDDEWLDGQYLGPHLQEMADCGFRIYEQEDFGHVFGFDGYGYDFYDAHWIPLYKARGLHWHRQEGEVA